MDNIICGLNKIVCHAINNSDNGKQVSITNGTNTWSATIADLTATLFVPSIPTPARKTYTVTLGDFSKEIPMEFGASYDVYLADGYDYVMEKDLDALEQSIVNLLYNGDSKSGVAFNFGIDAQGRYGYVKKVNGADTVIPFRTGQETLCYSLGTGRSFNIQTACQTIKNTYGIDVDYRTLTSANFVCQPTSDINVSKSGYMGNGDAAFSYTTWGIYNKPAITYNSTTGTLTISGSECQGKYRRESNGASTNNDTDLTPTNIKAYLIVPMNA